MQVVQTVQYVLWLYQLHIVGSLLLDLRLGKWSIEHVMGDLWLVALCLVHVVLGQEGAAEAKDEVLESVNWRFSIEQEGELLEELPLPLHLLVLLGQGYHFGRVFEFFRHSNFLNRIVVLFLELFLSDCLKLTDLLSLEEDLHPFFLEVSGHTVNVTGRIGQPKVSIELEVHKTEQRNIKLSECTDDLVIDFEGESLVELIWSDPSYLLSHYFDLVVSSLDAEECLCKALSNGAVSHPLRIKSLAHRNVFVLNLEGLMLREIGEK